MPASGLGSRTRMALLAGDNTREGRAMRNTGTMSRQRMAALAAQGDPFLGVIGKALGGLVKFGAKTFFGVPSTPAPAPFPDPFRGPGTIISGPVSKRIEASLPGPFFPRTSVPGGIDVGAAGFRRRRRMNPLNPRALRRALSRASAFSRFARKALHVTFGKAPKVRFRTGRRKK